MKPSAGRADRARRLAIIGAVGLVHAGLFALAGLTDGPPVQPQPQATINVELMRPPPPPPPPRPAPPAERAGGGAPAAPSRVHIPPKRVDRPPELIAPPVQAPEPALVVGVAETATPTPGMGQGGQGTGTGTGSGSGSGPGRGSTPPRIVRGPTQGDLRSIHPEAALRAGLSGEAVVRCYIRADQYLHRCAVVRARPGGQGFDEAGLLAARFYRFQPPTRDGVAQTDQPVTITVRFGGPLGPVD